MNLMKFQKLLKDNLTVKSWLDYVPEQQEKPAVSYIHVAHSAAKLLNGQKSGRSDSWRLFLVAEDEESLQALVEEVEQLDNIRTDDYQRVFANLNSGQAQGVEEPFRRAVFDIQTYEG